MRAGSNALQRHTAEGDGVADADGPSWFDGHAVEELGGVEVAVEAVEVGVVARTDSTPTSMVSVMSTAWVGSLNPIT